MQEQLSVREVESLVKRKAEDGQKKIKKATINPDIAALQNTLSETLGAAVSIIAKTNGSGTLKINYSNLDQLDEMIRKISR